MCETRAAAARGEPSAPSAALCWQHLGLQMGQRGGGGAGAARGREQGRGPSGACCWDAELGCVGAGRCPVVQQLPPVCMAASACRAGVPASFVLQWCTCAVVVCRALLCRSFPHGLEILWARASHWNPGAFPKGQSMSGSCPGCPAEVILTAGRACAPPPLQPCIAAHACAASPPLHARTPCGVLACWAGAAFQPPSIASPGQRGEATGVNAYFTTRCPTAHGHRRTHHASPIRACDALIWAWCTHVKVAEPGGPMACPGLGGYLHDISGAPSRALSCTGGDSPIVLPAGRMCMGQRRSGVLRGWPPRRALVALHTSCPHNVVCLHISLDQFANAKTKDALHPLVALSAVNGVCRSTV